MVADRCRNATTVVKLFNCNNKIIIQFFKEVPSSTVPHSDLATSSILTAVHGPHPTCLNPGGGTVFNLVDGDLLHAPADQLPIIFQQTVFNYILIEPSIDFFFLNLNHQKRFGWASLISNNIYLKFSRKVKNESTNFPIEIFPKDHYCKLFFFFFNFGIAEKKRKKMRKEIMGND